MLTIVEIVVPALVVLTTLFGLLARGNPKPGGVALFFRVGAVGLMLGGAAWYVTEHTQLLRGARPEVLVNAPRGLVGGGLLLLAMAAFGAALKKRR